MSRSARFAILIAASGLAGCVSRADLVAQDRRLSQQLGDQRKQIQSIQRELERLRGDMEGGPRRGGEGAATIDQRLQDVEDRLARIEGHVRGIQRMLEEEETCDDVLVQLAAVRGATTQVIAQLLHSHLETCIAHCAANGSATEAIAALEKALATVLRQT